MKKLLALILAVSMLLGVCSAFAESTDKIMVPYDQNLSFAMVYPEGYTGEYEVDENGILIDAIVSEDETAPNFLLVVGQDNSVEDVSRLNDLSDDDKTAYAEDLTEDLSNPSWEIQETALGTEVIVINENGADYDLVTLTTIYYGMVVTLYIGHSDGTAVTDEDVATGMQIFSDMDFVSTITE